MSNITGYDEVEERACIHFTGCVPVAANGIHIKVSEAYDDSGEPQRDDVLIECHGGFHGIRFHLHPDLAEALAKVILDTARRVRLLSHSRISVELDDLRHEVSQLKKALKNAKAPKTNHE